jgi:hypothetical protein
VRLVLEDPTGGLVDHIKLCGSFQLRGDGDAGYRMVTPSGMAEPSSWTIQGYPFFSGRGVYTTTFELTGAAAEQPLRLEVPMVDDVLEVDLNGETVGVRLWDPYVVDLSAARVGENQLALRIANTPANLLNGTLRPSGLAGPPRLVLDAQTADVVADGFEAVR